MTSPAIMGDAVTTAPIAANTIRSNSGHVAFENQNYRIRVNDTGEVLITNKETSETYRIWGDPHVDIDGKRAFDFWGQTTFQLQDGTKVTIETTPWKGGGANGVATISSKVTITDGDYAAVVTGVDDNRKGDLNFTEYHGHGQMVDANVDDGNVLYENMDGAGFITARGEGVDQAYIDRTDLLKNSSIAVRPSSVSGDDVRFDGSAVWQSLLPMLQWNLDRDSGETEAPRRRNPAPGI